MKFLFFLLSIFFYSNSYSLDCFYDFDTKKIEINQEKGIVSQNFLKGQHKYKIFIKNAEKPNEIDDYLVKENLTGEYKMTYSLNCQ